jgi:hypothetical protein
MAFRFIGDFRPLLPHKFNGIELLRIFLHCLLSIQNKEFLWVIACQRPDNPILH